LYQLRTFAAVAELGSLTQAADRLHLSQPAASAQIKLLEEEFGVALFERKPSGLALTRAGTSLLPDIQALLACAHQVAFHAKSLSGRVTGPLRFATLATISDKSLLRLGEMMNLIVTRHPRLDIELQHQNSRGIIAGVANGDLDAGMALGSEDVPNICRIPLIELRYRVVAPASWGDGIRTATWRELASKRWISTPKGGSHHQMSVQLFKRLGCEPDTVIEADNEPVINGLVRAGLGLGLMREDIALAADASKDIIVVDKGRPSTYLQLVHRVGRENDPAIRAILGVVSELWPESERPKTKFPATNHQATKHSPTKQPISKHVTVTLDQTASDVSGAQQMPEQLPQFKGQRQTV
jgi:DNA-binding transcriptional LysR family regulator